MPRHDDVINPDERVVRFSETRRGRTRVFYAIHDEFMDYWRSTEPIFADRAWTRDLSLRARFPSRKAAGAELAAIWQYRREAA